MKKNILLISLCFIVFRLYSLSASSLEGVITAEGASPVADTTVVLLELDLITLTDADGRFKFDEIEEQNYTLLIIAPGFEELEMPVVPPFVQMQISMSPEIVEMDTIVVQADKSEPEDFINEGVTSKELERLPPRSDPFEALALEAGILKPLNVYSVSGASSGGSPASGGSQPVILREGRLSLGRSSGISVYGGESDWNNFYYNYMRLPTNTHTFGYPDADAIVPVEAVDSIGIYRGAYPVEYGPGIGGLFTLNPIEGVEKFELTFTPSIMDVSVISSVDITDNIGLLVSGNQSIINYTVLPVITSLSAIETEDELVEGDIPTSISYGDALLSFIFTPENHKISVDLLAYYDSWAFDLGFNDASLESTYGPYFISGGVEWIYSASASLSNTFYAFGSLYDDRGDFEFYLPSEESGWITDYDSHWRSDVNSLQAGEEIFWNISNDMSLVGGLNSRLSFLSGSYTDDNLVKDGMGLVLSDYDHNININEMILSVYGYGKILGSIDDFGYKLGTGLLWYPETGALRPAVEGEGVLSFEKLSFALAAGWSPGVIDDFGYIDRRLDELYYELETETSPYQPPMAFSAASQVVLIIDESSVLKFSPYFSWYYDLSGISVNTSYTDLGDNFVSLDPDKGYSTGIDIGWSTAIGENLDWDIGYAFSWTRYNTEKLGWVIPDTDVQHAIKSSALLTAGGFTASFNLFIYSGIPFIPDVIEADGFGGFTAAQGEYNSAVDYMPSYEFTANLNYNWIFEKFEMSLFWNSENLINGLNVFMTGLKSELENTIGSTTADFSSRKYEMSYTWTDALITLLTSEIGMSFSF